jgi:predicted membrane protein
MSDDKNKYVSGGTGFIGFLTLLFIHHKLIGTITWSWWWVLSPIWITAAFTTIVVAVIVLFGYLISKQ